MKRLTFEEMMNAPTPKTFVSEAIDYFVDFEVKETALERARRIWGMSDGESEGTRDR
jgi:hypothetical protein